MFRAGSAILVAMLVIAAAPIPKPLQESGGRNHANESNRPADSNANPVPPLAASQSHDETNDVSRKPGKREKEPGWFGIPFDGWVAIGTGVLVLATLVLAGFTGWLARATTALAKGDADQVDEMRKAYSLAERQFLLTGAAHDLAEKAHALNRLKMLAEHRPRIKIRSVALTKPNPNETGFFRNGHTIKGSLVIVNAGGTDAIIKEATYRFYWGPFGLPIAPPLDNADVKPLLADLPHTMPISESLLVPIESIEELIFAHELERTDSGVNLWVMGTIRYADFMDNDRWMGFCWQFYPVGNPNFEGHFELVANTSYRYED